MAELTTLPTRWLIEENLRLGVEHEKIMGQRLALRAEIDKRLKAGEQYPPPPAKEEVAGGVVDATVAGQTLAVDGKRIG